MGWHRHSCPLLGMESRGLQRNLGRPAVPVLSGDSPGRSGEMSPLLPANPGQGVRGKGCAGS